MPAFRPVTGRGRIPAGGKQARAAVGGEVNRGLRPGRAGRHRLRSGSSGETICRPSARDEFLSSENVRILESWNVESDPDLSIARARLEPGQCTEVHCLDGITERYLIVEGSAQVKVGSIPAAMVGPGDVVFVPPGVTQCISNTGDGDLVFYCLCTPAFRASRYRRVTSPPTGPGDE